MGDNMFKATGAVLLFIGFTATFINTAEGRFVDDRRVRPLVESSISRTPVVPARPVTPKPVVPVPVAVVPRPPQPPVITESKPPKGAINVLDFGAKGNGKSNDTAAFYAASRELQRRGGGTLWIPGVDSAGKKRTYIVGHQTFVSGKQTVASPIIYIVGTKKTVVIQGNGATLKAANGLKFGSFNPVTGAAYYPKMPFYGARQATYANNAYEMIYLERNSSVQVFDLNLDGNIANYKLGGQYGDVGWQLKASGLVAMNNDKILIRNLYTHHHGTDGIMIGYSRLTHSSSAKPVVLENVTSDYNGRQGFSLVGGNSVTVKNSKFRHTGQARIYSPPGSGVDIEAENSVVWNVLFTGCEIANNAGAGFVADSGPSSHVTIRNSDIWGTKNWALWLNKPYFRVEDSRVHGAIARAYGSADNPDSAVKFLRTTFDDTASREYGPVYGANYMIDFGGGGVANVSFVSSTFNFTSKYAFYVPSFGPAVPKVIISNSSINLPRASNIGVTSGISMSGIYYGRN